MSRIQSATLGANRMLNKPDGWAATSLGFAKYFYATLMLALLSWSLGGSWPAGFCNMASPLYPANSSAAGAEFAAYARSVSGNTEWLDEGEKIYQQKCARCHGAEGEGTEEYSEPLMGDLPLDELTDYISATMPEDHPESCVGDEARQVAQYVHRNFYSPEARLTPENTQVKFSRLTTRQLRESLADLVGSFDQAPWHPAERGLKAFYFASRHRNEKRSLADQIDSRIDYPELVPYFDPTGDYPQLEKIKAENQMGEGFSVYWSGSILAPQTGWYNFKVLSKNGFQLYVNSQREPLIDRKVRSDDVVEHSARRYLIAGRAYPFRLDFFSYPDPPARIQVKWQTPLGSEEVIPGQYFFPSQVSESLAVSVSFPADDASSGYERGISISQEWDAAVTASALETADWISQRLFHYAKTTAEAEDRLDKVKSFCHQFVELAFSKPLSEAEKQFFVGQHFENDLPLKDQVKRVVILTIKSPRFLYPASEARDPDFFVARQLALIAWDSIPDRVLWEQAKNKQLTRPEIVEEQLNRMLGDPRAKSKLHAFFAEWLNLDKSMQVARDPQRFVNFDEQLLLDSRRSLETFLEQLIVSEQADVRQLFTASHVYGNRRLAEFYGWQWPATREVEISPEPTPSTPSKDSQASETQSSQGQRIDQEATPPVETSSQLDTNEFVSILPPVGTQAGIVTHPYLMTGLAYYQHSSPIHRGVFVARKWLGRTLKQPNENFEPLTEDFDPKMTNRQRVEFQTKDKTCMACHSVINPLGFSLENYDAVGRFRTTEKDRPVDASAVYKTPAGNAVPLGNALDLARFLAEDEGAKRSFIRQFFQLYVRQPVEAYGNENLDELFNSFRQHQFNLRQLAKAVAKSTIRQQLQTSGESSGQ